MQLWTHVCICMRECTVKMYTRIYIGVSGRMNGRVSVCMSVWKKPRAPDSRGCRENCFGIITMRFRLDNIDELQIIFLSFLFFFAFYSCYPKYCSNSLSWIIIVDDIGDNNNAYEVMHKWNLVYLIRTIEVKINWFFGC